MNGCPAIELVAGSRLQVGSCCARARRRIVVARDWSETAAGFAVKHLRLSTTGKATTDVFALW